MANYKEFSDASNMAYNIDGTAGYFSGTDDQSSRPLFGGGSLVDSEDFSRRLRSLEEAAEEFRTHQLETETRMTQEETQKPYCGDLNPGDFVECLGFSSWYARIVEVGLGVGLVKIEWCVGGHGYADEMHYSQFKKVSMHEVISAMYEEARQTENISEYEDSIKVGDYVIYKEHYLPNLGFSYYGIVRENTGMDLLRIEWHNYPAGVEFEQAYKLKRIPEDDQRKLVSEREAMLESKLLVQEQKAESLESILQQAVERIEKFEVQQAHSITLEQRLDEALEKIKSLEAEGETEEQARVEQEELLPVLASMQEKMSKRQFVFQVATKLVANLGASVVKQVLRYSGINLEWVLKLIGLG